jgi:hypothetical protein
MELVPRNDFDGFLAHNSPAVVGIIPPTMQNKVCHLRRPDVRPCGARSARAGAHGAS